MKAQPRISRARSTQARHVSGVSRSSSATVRIEPARAHAANNSPTIHLNSFVVPNPAPRSSLLNKCIIKN